MRNPAEELRNGVVLAELGGQGNGPFCARNGAGAALVVMGTYVVDAGDAVPYPADFVFKPGRANYAGYLQEHVAAARGSGGKVGVSVISRELPDSVDFLQAAAAAGAGYVSLCAYSVMPMFTSVGLGVELCRRGNAARLRDWCTAIVKGVSLPLIIKMGLDEEQETSAAIGVMKECGVSLFHVAVDEAPQPAGLAAVKKLAATCPFLIVGGGIRDAQAARRVLEAGAGAVAIAGAAVKDPGVCGRIQRQLRGE
jgi:dihydroorotate dehydrogenase